MAWNTQDAHLIISAAHASQFPETHQKEIVMVGKSNVGKSSIINALTNRKKLAYVGQRPGKTRLINFYHINDSLLLTDVPGYGFANRSKKEQADYGILMDGYFELRHPSIMMILVDIRRGIAGEDEMMIEFAEYNKIDYCIVLTKTDKLSNSKIVSTKRKIENNYLVPVFTFSSLKNETVEPIIKGLQDMLDR